jgi:hypothetical protein
MRQFTELRSLHNQDYPLTLNFQILSLHTLQQPLSVDGVHWGWAQVSEGDGLLM